MVTVRIKYVYRSYSRHGRPMYHFRPPGGPNTRLPDDINSKAFADALTAAREAHENHRPQIGKSKSSPGSIDALIAAYKQTVDYCALRPSTKAVYNNVLKRFAAEHGHRSGITMARSDVAYIMAQMSDAPTSANRLLKMLKMLMRLALDMGWRKDDPTLKMRGYKIKSDGFHTWTGAQLKQFEDFWPIGTRERLALCLLRYTTQRISDVAHMGWQHVTPDGLRIKQIKTGTWLDIPIHPRLAEALSGVPKTNLTFLLNRYGRPFSVKGCSQWFSAAANQAGLPPECSAHGVRKASATGMADRGGTAHEIMSFTGHRQLGEVTRYTRAAEQKRIALGAVSMLDDEHHGNKGLQTTGEVCKIDQIKP